MNTYRNSQADHYGEMAYSGNEHIPDGRLNRLIFKSRILYSASLIIASLLMAGCNDHTGFLLTVNINDELKLDQLLIDVCLSDASEVNCYKGFRVPEAPKQLNREETVLILLNPEYAGQEMKVRIEGFNVLEENRYSPLAVTKKSCGIVKAGKISEDCKVHLCPFGQVYHDNNCKRGCLIENVYYSSGESPLSNPCLYCEPDSSVDNWTPKEKGTICDQATGAECNNEGVCVFPENICSLIITVFGGGTVQISNNPENSCQSNCSFVFTCGDRVELVAIPEHDTEFMAWEGDISAQCLNSREACILIMDQNRKVIAGFREIDCREDNDCGSVQDGWRCRDDAEGRRTCVRVCMIGEEEIAAGELKPGETCRVCNPERNINDWSNKDFGVECTYNDGSSLDRGTCDNEGTCGRRCTLSGSWENPDLYHGDLRNAEELLHENCCPGDISSCCRSVEIKCNDGELEFLPLEDTEDSSDPVPHNLYPDCRPETPSVGTICMNGSVYAGFIEWSGGNAYHYYTTPTDLMKDGNRRFIRWHNVDDRNNYLHSEALSKTDGMQNTTTLTGSGHDYSAAIACNDFIAHGRSDWYLPARQELKLLLWENRSLIGNFSTENLGENSPNMYSSYWSSTEVASDHRYAWSFSFDIERFQQTEDKDHTLFVRCVRRELQP